jgi:NAD(P)-dependent dehydrogenase (short-subunit alcohol dehydrogenase family)
MKLETVSDSFRLDGRTVVVTGGAGILGRRFCLGLAARGANVAVIDIDQASAAAVVSDIGTKAIAVECDVASSCSVATMVEKVVQRFGGLDVLLNNAASKSNDLNAFFAPFEDYSLEEWRKVMAVNLDGMFLVAQAAGRQMVSQGRGGSIVQTASIYGVVAPDQRIYEGSEYQGRQINTPAVYAASKAGVIGLTRYLATYWAAKGIRVNALTPGGVSSGQNDAFHQRYSARVPLGRMAERDEMVGAAVFLASDASSYVTGQNLIVDGGLSVW